MTDGLNSESFMTDGLVTESATTKSPMTSPQLNGFAKMHLNCRSERWPPVAIDRSQVRRQAAWGCQSLPYLRSIQSHCPRADGLRHPLRLPVRSRARLRVRLSPHLHVRLHLLLLTDYWKRRIRWEWHADDHRGDAGWCRRILWLTVCQWRRRAASGRGVRAACSRRPTSCCWSPSSCLDGATCAGASSYGVSSPAWLVWPSSSGRWLSPAPLTSSAGTPCWPAPPRPRSPTPRGSSSRHLAAAVNRCSSNTCTANSSCRSGCPGPSSLSWPAAPPSTICPPALSTAPSRPVPSAPSPFCSPASRSYTKLSMKWVRKKKLSILAAVSRTNC